MRTLTMEEQVTKIRDLVYDIRTALCWPLEKDEKITSSMVDFFLETEKFKNHEKTRRLKEIWDASSEILDIMGGDWNKRVPPDIHHREQCRGK